MRPPRISVVIPLFNKALHIRRAVESVLNQSFQEFEIVVVDDGSTDGSAGIVRNIGDARIRLVQQPNGGVSSARNRGIKESRNELISFLDADDSYNPEFLSVILDLAERHEAAGAYGTSFEIIKENRQRTVWQNYSLREAGTKEVLIHRYFRDVLSGPVIWSSATAIHKRIFNEVGFFPEGVQLGEDLDMWMRIAAKFPIAVSSYVGAIYHRDATNRTDNGRIRGVEYELVKTGLRIISSSQLDGEQEKYLREYISRYQITTAYHLVLLGQRDRARKMLLQCRTRRFVFIKMWWLFWTLIPTPVTIRVERMVRRILTTRALRLHDAPGIQPI
jgi:glycosyltransferase involved in cell wall biosynthesis